MELQLVSFCLADTELLLVVSNEPAFAALKVKYADVLGRAPCQPACLECIYLELETGASVPGPL